MQTRKPIPLNLPSIDGWKKIPIKECPETLVPLGLFSENEEIFTRAIYAGEGIESPYYKNPITKSLLTMFVREEVAKQLKVAQSLLPKNFYLVIFDAFRVFEVQKYLFDKYLSDLKKLHPDWEEGNLITETQKYASLPSKDPTRPSPHSTGGTVDLAIIKLSNKVSDKNKGRMLDFGTPYDFGGEKASSNYYEKLSLKRTLNKNEIKFRDNRRLLYQIMKEAGFQKVEKIRLDNL